ncbi:MAG: deoxyuridine 5'-triphosphate nucleotidohydrolase [Candidatus Kariarchaeaceae archaeon]|jgi:dUTP pyrophosphatase
MPLLTPHLLVGVVRRMMDPIAQIQSAGIDLTLQSVDRFVGEGFIAIHNSERTLPLAEELSPDKSDVYSLTPGGYQVRYNESIHVPLDAAGLVLPRSSLMRSGAVIHSALWDPGYQGVGMGLMTVTNPIKIQKNARIAQIIFFTLSEGAELPYQGAYQGEGIEE